MWFCDQCGAQNPEEAAFCAACGAARPAPVKKPARRSRRGLLIGGIVLALALIGLALFLLLPGGPKLKRITRINAEMVREEGYTRRTQTVYTYTGDGGTAEYWSQGERSESFGRLTLNEKGQPVREDRYYEDGEYVGGVEWEYDDRGNQSVQRNYDADGVLQYEIRWEFDENRVMNRYYTGNYGLMDTKTEFVMTDKTSGICNIYRLNGSEWVLQSSLPVRRVYEGNRLVCQQILNPEGGVATETTWVRDADNWILEARIVNHSAGYEQITRYQYEVIG